MLGSRAFKGPDLNIQIGQNGKPLNAGENLSVVQRDFITENISKLRSAVDKIQRWNRYKNLPTDCKKMNEVWIFNGRDAKFPSAVFIEKKDAEKWISQHHLSGILTKYPVNISVYDWALETKNFKIKTDKDCSREFIQKFSSAAQEHSHYENGIEE